MTSSPVTVVNGTTSYPLSIPINLAWGQVSTEASKKAIEFQFREISTEVSKLKSRGASSIKKTFVKNPRINYVDWKNYVPTISQYTLQGFNANGKAVGTSKKLPSDVQNLASRLVYLKQKSCVISQAIRNPKLETCTIAKPTTQTYLRAALRTSTGMGQLMDLGGDIYQQLVTCLSNKSPFTVEDGIFNCPANAEIFGGNSSIAMMGEFATRSYSISIDEVAYTAILTYGPRDFSKVALRGSYEGGSVVSFR